MFINDELEIDITKLRYVLYVRKSTDDPERQVRSIDDQIAECLEYAKRVGIKVVGKPIIEKQSAKKPNLRPLFRQMLKDIREGKYDGILSWHPDRLARNMREGGEVIDMIDEGQIKDLKFVAHHFSNDPSGKMLLGMAFVLSKEYSDRLSVVVKRGVGRNLEEGKSAAYKHGYYRDKEGYYRPDGKNFQLIKEAWQMRKARKSIEEIADYMNSQGYMRVIKRKDKKIRRVDMDKRILSKIFRDSLFMGVLLQKGKEVDLRTKYDFVPAVSEDEYFLVQDQSLRHTTFLKRQARAFYPFKGILRCAFCGSSMRVAPSLSGTKNREHRLLYCRCDNELCTREKRSCRVRFITEFIDTVLKDGLNLTEKEYQIYLEGMKQITDEQRGRFERDIRSLRGRQTNVNLELSKRSLAIIDFDKSSPVYEVNLKQIEELKQEKEQLVRKIDELTTKLIDPEKIKLSLEQFLNLSKSAAMAVKSADAIKKDAICRIIFLNVDVGIDNVASYRLKPPFDTLMKTRQIPLSRGARNRTEAIRTPCVFTATILHPVKQKKL